MDKLETAAKVAFRRIHCGFDTSIDGRQQNDQNPDFKELCFSVNSFLVSCKSYSILKEATIY